MIMPSLHFLSLLTFASSVTAWGVPSQYAFDRGYCQSPTKNPLEGCPPGTLIVGEGQRYTTIQSAVLSLGNTTTPAVILIEPGNYAEQVGPARLEHADTRLTPGIRSMSHDRVR